MGVVFGIYLDIVLGKSVGITGLVLGIVGALAEILSKNFSKDSRFTIMLMVISTTFIFESVIYVFNILRTDAVFEIFSFLKILLVEIIFNSLLTIILYPLMKKA